MIANSEVKLRWNENISKEESRKATNYIMLQCRSLSVYFYGNEETDEAKTTRQLMPFHYKLLTHHTEDIDKSFIPKIDTSVDELLR